jgi:uncharacterized membrane protein YphA (DoxX/SURF4 family)
MCKFINRKLLKILSLIAGTVFLFSGIGKSLAANDFAQIFTQYGFESLRFLAPFIIILEVALGVLLFFYFRLKQTSFVALCFVAGLSLVYLYGYLFVNITDCGCFGYFSFLNMSPAFTFVRNFILICVLLCVFLNGDNSYKMMDKNEIAITLCILCAVCFVTGYTYVERHKDAMQYVANGKYSNTDVKNTVLGEFINFSKDSTYLVFAFSYSCPHCYNSIENLKEYERSGIADKVVALSFKTDTSSVNKFNNIFKPDFEIKIYPPKQLFQLTNQFPISYYIKNNKVKLEIHGVLPCWYILLQQLQKMQK